MPTYGLSRQFLREFERLTPADQVRFMRAVHQLVAALGSQSPAFPPGLRVKRVKGAPDIWELSWAPDGRATFRYGEEIKLGEAHVIWRRVGKHSILDAP